jgi:hypothetical protein
VKAFLAVPALVLGAGLASADAPSPAAAAEACPAAPAPRTVRVLVELAGAPPQKAYESALASASAGDQASREAAARAAERAQDQAVKEAQASVARGLTALGARELYRVRHSFNGISVVAPADELEAIRALPGVKAVHPSEPSGSGLRAYVDPATGRLTAAPADDQVHELDRSLADVADRSSEGLEIVTGPDGTQRVFLRGRFRSFSTATISATGAVRLDCVDAHVSSGRPPGGVPAEAGKE